MPTYLSPGVYVEEVASGSAPIAGVGTSTAGFIGIIGSTKAAGENSSPPAESTPTKTSKTESITGKASTKRYPLTPPTGATQVTLVKVMVKGENKTEGAEIKLSSGKQQLILATDSDEGENIEVEYTYIIPAASSPGTQTASKPTTQAATTYPLSSVTVEDEVISAKAGQTPYELAAPAGASSGTIEKLTVKGVDAKTGASITSTNGKLQLTLSSTTTVAAGDEIKVSYTYAPPSVSNLSVTLCTNFAEFKKAFGDFPTVAEETAYPGRRTLTHAVYGFFNNGGTRCYVVWVNPDEIDKALDKFEAIDEIAIVAVPGATDAATLGKVDAHCRQITQDRFAIFDAPQNPSAGTLKPGGELPAKSDYAALYYPWIKVYDPAVKGSVDVPPSGHIAGVYARVDSQRGVYKAPANEPIFGALGVTDAISKRKQDGLNPQGVNCIRELNGSIQVWGARTWGGDDNGEFKYISTRRLFNYLRESIDEGTQWTVFEPNSPELWAKIRRSVTVFLTTVWQTGALFGTAPEQAFFVKCDEETNPPEVREQGQVVTIIGVSVVKPAEFVIFRISQWAGPGGN